MKKLLLFLFLIPVLAKAQQPTREALAKEFIAAIKTNNQQKFTKLFPEGKMMREIFSGSVKKNPELAADSAEILASLDDMSDEYREMFKDAMKKIKAKKIDPAQITYKSATFETDNGDDDMPGVQMYKGIIVITAAGKNYYIKTGGIIKYKGAFYGMELDDVGAGTAPKKATGG